MSISRRDFLKWAAEASALGAAGLAFPALASAGKSASARIPYGVAVHHESLWEDRLLREAIPQWCDQITIENALKMQYVLVEPDHYDLAIADSLCGYAIQNDLGVHGHTLVWYAALPEWVERLEGSAAERLMNAHIEKMMLAYRHVIKSWDVVNEAIPDYPDAEDSLRQCVWSDAMGPGYVAQAFERAHEVMPEALLVLNEYDIEFAIDNGPAKRAAFRNLVYRLLDAGAPLHAIGFQAHLRGGWPIATEEVAALVTELKGLGLEILVTELDVIDNDLPASPADRDQLVAAQVFDFLDAVYAGGSPRSVSTWGLTDQHSWIRWILPRDDGVRNRPLPLDWDYQPKPFMGVLQHFLERTE